MPCRTLWLGPRRYHRDAANAHDQPAGGASPSSGARRRQPHSPRVVFAHAGSSVVIVSLAVTGSVASSPGPGGTYFALKRAQIPGGASVDAGRGGKRLCAIGRAERAAPTARSEDGRPAQPAECGARSGWAGSRKQRQVDGQWAVAMAGCAPARLRQRGAGGPAPAAALVRFLSIKRGRERTEPLRALLRFMERTLPHSPFSSASRPCALSSQLSFLPFSNSPCPAILGFPPPLPLDLSSNLFTSFLSLPRPVYFAGSSGEYGHHRHPRSRPRAAPLYVAPPGDPVKRRAQSNPGTGHALTGNTGRHLRPAPH